MDTTTGATVRNWFGDLEQHPAAVVTARSVDDVVTVLTDPATYPSPVRAIGSNHSTTMCGIADGGTIVEVSAMNDIVEIGDDYVTAQAGALYIDVAKELERRGLQFFVNVELGNLSIGSASTGGTKDASMPNELGQVSSYAISIKMVKPDGELVEITEEDEALIRAMRTSHGLLGIVYEATFRVQRLRPLRLRHQVYTVDEFIAALPELRAEGDSMMYYLFPFLDRIGVEFRRYQDSGEVKSHWPWWVRNKLWSTFAPGFARTVARIVPGAAAKSWLINAFNRILLFFLNGFVQGSHTSPTDQMIRYPDRGGYTSYTFSIWAFPEEHFPATLRNYYDFCRLHYEETGYRCDLLNVGYRVAEDRSLLFSYSWDGTMMTLDPVSTGQEGWDDFLKVYNAFCSDAGGVPLFNQTKHMTPQQAKRAFGDRLGQFEELRKRYDPADRLLNQYFRERLG